MKFGIISIFPEMFKALTDFGVTGRAVKKGLLEIIMQNPRDYPLNKRGSVDDRPFGGGPGMVMALPPLISSIRACKERLGLNTKVILMCPQGERVQQDKINSLITNQNPTVFIAGRYEGVDDRINEYIDERWSIADIVLSGGELAIMAILDAAIRLIPGALGHPDSALLDSFAKNLEYLDHPHYTRPEVFEGIAVPAVLMSGNHAKISAWRRMQSYLRTKKQRPELLSKNLGETAANMLRLADKINDGA